MTDFFFFIFFTGADFILSFAAELDDEETIAYENELKRYTQTDEDERIIFTETCDYRAINQANYKNIGVIAYKDSIANTFYVGLVKAHGFNLFYKLLNMVPEKKRKTLKNL